jgi:hypothetical protein
MIEMQHPPRDENNQVIPHDDPQIPDHSGIIRRISEQQLTDPDANGKRRISSKAFKPSNGDNGGMSVDLQMFIESAGLDAQKYVTTPRWIGSVSFIAGALRGKDFKVGYDPLPENVYHGEVWGAFSRSQIRYLQDNAIWFVPIRNVDLR